MEIEKENGGRSTFSFFRLLGDGVVITGRLIRIPLTIGFFANLFILIRDVAVM